MRLVVVLQDKFLIQAGRLEADYADAGDPKVLFDSLAKEAVFDQKLMCVVLHFP